MFLCRKQLLLNKENKKNTAAAALGKNRNILLPSHVCRLCVDLLLLIIVSPFSGRGILGLRDCEGCLVWWDLR